MANGFKTLYQELWQDPQSVLQVLIVFLSLYTVFGLLVPADQFADKNFSFMLLMGLGYIILNLSFACLFQEDLADGTMEWRLSQQEPLEKYIIIKITGHWLRFGLMLTLMAGVMTGFGSLPLLGGMALTSLTLTLTGAIGSALCLDQTLSSFILLPLLTLPLGIPVLLVNTGFMTGALTSTASFVTLQASLFLMALSLSLVACPYILRLSLR